MNVQEALKRSNNWQEFKSHVDPLGTKEKGDCFELLTWYYLKLDPKYATKFEEVWLLKDVPQKVRNHINLPVQDEGIDIVAKTNDGEYWAVQSKYKADKNTSITRKELSTFTDLSFSICRNITTGLVCTTADRFSGKVEISSTSPC